MTLASDEPELVARELLAGASIEIDAGEMHSVAEAVRSLGPGREVFIPWTPKLGAAELVGATSIARELGLVPIPHLVARRIGSEAAARDLLKQLRGHGAASALLVGGDVDEPAGPYACSLDLMRSGLLQQHGFTRVGVAGYPEGHPRISAATLSDDLRRKLDDARSTGLGAFIVSQFCFDGALVARWAAGLRAGGVAVPIRAGVAGPTTVARLMRLGVRCGIGSSLRALKGRFGTLARLAGTHEPADVVHELARARLAQPSLEPLAVHVFAFGGASATAQWLARTSRESAGVRKMESG
ncbi:MAG TPA: methylenetetrahydrofolate reductase [Zeimonas sp.]|nr:methylenetetrahydrofolate reductase [Zeimonas sp.]